MNAYDFDKTIYPGDSAAHFWRWCVRRHPAAALRAAAVLGPAFRTVMGDMSRGELKQGLFAVLRGIGDPVREAELFWDRHIDRIYPWYLARRRDDDLIISASPDFLIAEACRRLGIAHMATDMDPATGRLRGPNCWGGEKVRRYKAVYGDTPVEEFYSDSLSDLPMMALAARGYLVKNGAVVRLVDPAAPGGKVPKK
jgi:phosphoserine phosphatase